MTPNLRLDQHQRFKTALKKRLSDARERILKNTKKVPRISRVPESMTARGRLET